MVPAVLQRIVMAKNLNQAKKAYIYAAGASVLMFLFVSWVGILLLASNPNLEPGKLLNFILDNYSYPWLKGLIAIGITAMAMSTADSDLNASAVLFVSDILKPLGIFQQKVMLLTRILAFVLGAFALIIALNMEDLLSILLLSGSFYMPIVSVPFLLAILGFRSTKRAVFIGMAAGLMMVLGWEIGMRHAGIDSLGMGMVVNLIFFMGSHYILKEPGGWVGIKVKEPLIAARQSRRAYWHQWFHSIKHMNLYTYLQKNLPPYEVIYALFGLYVIGATYASFYTISTETVEGYKKLYDWITHSAKVDCYIVCLLPILLGHLLLKKKGFITFTWPAGIGLYPFL